MNTKELLKKVRKIEIKTKRLSNHIFGGEYHSTFKGRGMTFSEVRQYQYGDDIRAIDWNVTARYNEPYIKVFEEERELTMMLMVDVSGSKLFGTSTQFKKDTVTEIAATLAFSAIQNNDKVGLILFSDQIELYIPPKKGKSHVLRIIRELIEFSPKSRKTNINEALKFLSSVMKKKAIVFMLSDFVDEKYERNLKIVGNKHDLTGIRIYDKFDEEIPNLGMVPMLDNETQEVRLINTSSKSVRNIYKANAVRLKDEFQTSFKKSGLGTINVRVDESYVKKLLGYFKNKG
ncbi:hypothetical protein BTO06_14220 [Tenacibaculum sp. SZ-18]|uniref:DUF58 domain-containing protein n=1 Tax=Tenacibaculum sp. SZ-18 TaxID=754423 RepID=UPI000C2D3F1B|nr:DUF58 domain-containing protein [Tenacibaculum sp. SZ-18]AUC16245.1 hypothetical protein BTO06_14220 [Tenacibaculum sp. SZ-18]